MSNYDNWCDWFLTEREQRGTVIRVVRWSPLLAAAALLAACEQQVANAEQPSSAASEHPAGSAEASSSGMTEGSHPKGKLVFDKPACQLPNRGGEVTGDCSVIARIGPERNGHLTYGPYAPLAAGDYTFEFDYRSSAPELTPAGEWDAAARLGSEEIIVAKGSISGSGNAKSTLIGRFSMPQRNGVPVIEIRMSPSLMAETEITRLRIYEVPTVQ